MNTKILKQIKFCFIQILKREKMAKIMPSTLKETYCSEDLKKKNYEKIIKAACCFFYYCTT